MSILRPVGARLHPKKPGLIANGIQPSGWIYPILTMKATASFPGFDLTAEHELETCRLSPMTGSESAPRTADHRSQPTRAFLNY
jgi:hypothetical protein